MSEKFLRAGVFVALERLALILTLFPGKSQIECIIVPGIFGLLLDDVFMWLIPSLLCVLQESWGTRKHNCQPAKVDRCSTQLFFAFSPNTLRHLALSSQRSRVLCCFCQASIISFPLPNQNALLFDSPAAPYVPHSFGFPNRTSTITTLFKRGAAGRRRRAWTDCGILGSMYECAFCGY